MLKAIAINGSPLKAKGDTDLILSAFLASTSSGCDYERFYTSRLKIKSCACGMMRCWYGNPGKCIIQDDMQLLTPKIKAAELLIFPHRFTFLYRHYAKPG